MDVASLRLDTLNIRVEPCKQFSCPAWAVPGNSGDTGAGLHVIKGGEVVDTLKVDDNRLYTLFGRCPTASDGAGVCVKLEHPSVSRIHAAVLRGKENLFYVIDLGSSHGTFISGNRVEPFSATALYDRSVLTFGQSTRRYIVRISPKNVEMCNDTEEINTVMNCMVSYKQQSPPKASDMIEEAPPKLERRVSFSCLAPEIIPTHPLRTAPILPETGPLTPMAVVGGSPEVTWTRKAVPCSPKLTLEASTLAPQFYVARAKSDSLPSIQANSGSEEDDENMSSFESLELSPALDTIDEMREVIPMQPLSAPTGRKTFFKRLPSKIEAFTKRVRPDL